MFFHLGFEVFNGLLYLVENAPLKGDILDDVHLSANFLLCAVVLDETDTGTREKILRTLAKKKYASRADLWHIALVGEESFILLQVLHRRLAITNALHVCFYGIHIDVFNGSIIGRTVLVISFTLVIHQLQTLLEWQFARLVTYSPKHFIGLVGMQTRTGRNMDYQYVVVIALAVLARHEFCRHRDGGHTEIEWSAQYLVQVSLVLVNTLDTASLIGYTYGNHAAIGICHSDNGVGESFRFDVNALAVESLPLGHLPYIFYCISHILFRSTLLWLCHAL